MSSLSGAPKLGCSLSGSHDEVVQDDNLLAVGLARNRIPILVVGIVRCATSVILHAGRRERPVCDVEADGRVLILEFPGLAECDPDHFSHPRALYLVEIGVPAQLACI